MCIYIYCEYILLSTGISIYSFFALNTIEYIYVLFNIPLAYMIWSSSKLEIPFWRMLVWLWHKDSLKFSGRFFFATVTGVFCDGWVIPDSNVFFFATASAAAGFFASVHEVFCNGARVFCNGASCRGFSWRQSPQHSRGGGKGVKEDEESRRRRRVKEPSLWQRGLMAERLDR